MMMLGKDLNRQCTLSHIMVTSLRSKWAVGSVGMRSRVSGAACPHDSKHRLEAYATLGGVSKVA
jgi:hypothetical protein